MTNSTVESLSQMGLEASAVGNHEFDKRHRTGSCGGCRVGGCHPVDGCQGGHDFKGASFHYLAASTVDIATGKTVFPPYYVKTVDGIAVAFIGLALKDVPGMVSPGGVAGLEIPRRGRNHQRAGARAACKGHRGDRRSYSPGRGCPAAATTNVSGIEGPHRRYRQEAGQGGECGGERPQPSSL